MIRRNSAVRLGLTLVVAASVAGASPSAALAQAPARQPVAQPKPAAPKAPAAPPLAKPPAVAAKPTAPTAPAATSPAPAAKPSAVAPASPETKPAAPQNATGEKHLLRYKFQPHETIRWRVEHRSFIRTTVRGVTESAESFTESIKVWKVVEVDDEGQAVFEHLVDSVKMRQKHSGRSELSYDSQSDSDPPPIFKKAQESVGKVLSMVRLDARGLVLKRENKHAAPGISENGPMTLILPEEAVAVGSEWNQPEEFDVSLPDGNLLKVKARQHFKLLEVRDGVAIIRQETQFLTPVREPSIEAQLVQREQRGEVHFDLGAGRIVSQQFDLDKPVVGFSGKQSSMQCRTRFVEELLTSAPSTALLPSTDDVAPPKIR